MGVVGRMSLQERGCRSEIRREGGDREGHSDPRSRPGPWSPQPPVQQRGTLSRGQRWQMGHRVPFSLGMLGGRSARARGAGAPRLPHGLGQDTGVSTSRRAGRSPPLLAPPAVCPAGTLTADSPTQPRRQPEPLCSPTPCSPNTGAKVGTWEAHLKVKITDPFIKGKKAKIKKKIMIKQREMMRRPQIRGGGRQLEEESSERAIDEDVFKNKIPKPT